MKFKFYLLMIALCTMVATEISSMAFREYYHTPEKFNPMFDKEKLQNMKDRSLLIEQYADLRHYSAPWDPYLKHYIDMEDIVSKCRKEIVQEVAGVPGGVASIIAGYDYGHAADIMGSITVADLKKHYFSHIPSDQVKIAKKNGYNLSYQKDSDFLSFAPYVLFKDTNSDKK